jgi:putative FmdB family regulatory protein
VPTYEYACTECADRLEVAQSFSDDPLTVCPACGGKLRKVFQPVGIVFKGSGFYRTDSRAKEKAATGSADAASPKKDSASQDGASSGTANGSSGSSGKDKAASGPASAGSGGSSKSASTPAGSKVA